MPPPKPNTHRFPIILATLALLAAGGGYWLSQITAPTADTPSATPAASQSLRDFKTRPTLRTSLNQEALTASQNSDIPSHAIPNERILTFPSEAEYRRFLANNNGAYTILASSDALRSVRIKWDNANSSSSLPSSAQADFNYTVLTPLPINPDSQALDKAFGNTALDFMRVPFDNKKSGAGVTIAILDTGIRDHSILDSKNIERYGTDSPETYLSHGTAVASLIAGQDGLGIAPQAKLIGIQVLDTDGIGDAFTLAASIVQAVDAGADIINMSLGSYGSNLALSNAVDYANAKGVVLVASAGNEAINALPYPAAYDSVIAVSAIDASGHTSSFSNQSPAIDIAAPGVGIFAAWENEQWTSFSGTSASAPYVSGAIAALSSELDIPATEAATLLLANADDAGLPGNDPQLGRGYVDLQRSYDSNTSYTDLALSDIYLSPTLDENGQNTLYITAQNRGTQAIPAASLNFTLPNGITQNVYLGALEPGETTSYLLSTIDSDLAQPYDYTITAKVDAGYLNEDKHTQNDSKTTVIAKPVEKPKAP